MKQIKLTSINYHNFKGIKDFSFEPDGESITISGDNATGKTTLFDGFTWLLFGKNSDDIKQFNPKPLNSDGTEQLGLDPEVTATIEVDGKQVELSRKLAEKWSTPRGKAEKVRKPDVTELTIDSVPKKVKEFSAYVATIIDEGGFKLLTNPFTFNSLKWSDRREILLKLVPDIDVNEAIDKVSDPDALRKLLADHTPDEKRAMIKASRRKLKNQIDGLPSRIDEATRAIPTETGKTDAELNTTLTDLNAKLADAQTALRVAGSDNLNLDAREAKAKLQSDYSNQQASYLQGNNLALSSLMEDIQTQQISLNEKRSKLSTATASLNQSKTALEVAENKRTELLKKYHLLDDKKFNEDSLVCPTCGQDLQPDKQDDIRKHFNVERSNGLAEIKKDGKKAAADISQVQADIYQQQQLVTQLGNEFNRVQAQLDQLNNDYNQTKAAQTPFEETAKAIKLQAEIDKQQQLIASGTGDSSKAHAMAQERVNSIQLDIDGVKADLANGAQIKQQQVRVQELHDQEVQLKETYADLDKQSFLLDQYTRTKVTLQEQKINALFKYVDFKLFDIQKNGEINEVCEAMVDGVPYSTDLNNAAKINAGLDIINTLSSHYQVVAPIFIDNAESVNDVIETDAQQIALVVSHDKELTVSQLEESQVA